MVQVETTGIIYFNPPAQAGAPELGIQTHVWAPQVLN